MMSCHIILNVTRALDGYLTKLRDVLDSTLGVQ